ncbi:MAG: helix-turn-helix domain-containing protein [Bacteroidetes bacterium]|nr:helix-turn-helix domain-containing protein [Bacteroidota bacterium]
MKSKFKSYDLDRLLTSAAKRFGQEVQQDCQKRWINLHSEPAFGTLCTYNFEDGVEMLLLNGTAPEDWEITTQSKVDSPFLLYFCVRGDVEFSFTGLAEPIVMQPMKTIMVAHPAQQSQLVHIKGGINTTFVWLKLERQLYINHIGCLPDAVRAEVVNIFNGETVVKSFLNSEFGLKSAALVQQIMDDKKDGLIHATFAESKAIELFSLQLRRWETEIMPAPGKSGMLRPEDLEKIIMARNLLVADLKNAPTIEVLSRKSGVNRQKLKQGFKKMFGTTINEYVRNERMRMARQLMAAGNPVIKEVAASVGYENSSYFARRYKEKYGLYPNEYLRTMSAIGEEE